MKINIENRTITALTFCIAIILVLMGLSKLSILRFNFTSQLWSGLFLLMGAVLLFIERGDTLFKQPKENFMYSIVIIVSSFLSVLMVIGRTLPPALEGVSGFIYLITAVFLVIELFK